MKSFAALPQRTKIVFGVSALGVVLGLFLLLRALGAPSYTLLASGVDPKDAGKITTALDDQGIAYELRANGTSVAVEKAQLGKARIALADANVDTGAGSGAGPGFELFDKQSMGASDMQQQVNYQRALEGEITKTVNGVAGVSGSSVQLVMPEDDLFADEQTPATAAVLLDNPADTLAPGAVRGIAQLVSSSVKGLSTDKVTITDATGQVLWPSDDGTGGAAGASAGSAKQSAQARYASQLESNVNAMLTRTLGPNKAQVQINADLNMDKVSRDELRYAKKGVPLQTTKETERLQGAGAGGAAGGTTGTGGNIPQYTTGNGAGGANGNGNYNSSKGSTNWGVDKTVSKIEQAPGAVNKLSVSLMLDSSVPQPADVQKAVAAAVGIDPTRGDTIQQIQIPFQKVAAPKSGPVPSGLLGLLKWVGLGLGVLLFAFLSWRGLRKREKEPLTDPEWLRQIAEPVPLAALESTTVMPAVETDDSLRRLDALMEREPERVAAQVRAWMAEE